MISPAYRNVLYGLALIGIVIMLTMPDVVMGLSFELVHFFFELLFISFEGIESLLDKIVEHSLHTELHETQTIVFYLMVGIAVLPLYYLSRMLWRFFVRLKVTLPEAWSLYKTRATLFWEDLSLIDKIKWIVITTGAIYLASFIFM